MIDAWRAVLRSFNLGLSLTLVLALTLSLLPNHSCPKHDPDPKPRRAELRNTFAQLHEAVRDADTYPPPSFKMPPKERADGDDGGAACSGASRSGNGGSRGGAGAAGGSLGGSMGPARAATAGAAVPHMMTIEQRTEHEAGLAAGAERGRIAREEREKEETAKAYQAAFLEQYQRQQQEQQQEQLLQQQSQQPQQPQQPQQQQPAQDAAMAEGGEEDEEDEEDEETVFVQGRPVALGEVRKESSWCSLLCSLWGALSLLSLSLSLSGALLRCSLPVRPMRPAHPSAQALAHHPLARGR
mgnify:CR=1 FL=1